MFVCSIFVNTQFERSVRFSPCPVTLIRMYNGIGLRTPRGSGTNGYVQRNLAALRASKKTSYELAKEFQRKDEGPKVNTPDAALLEHERKRKIEVKLMEWAEERNLLDSGYVRFAHSFLIISNLSNLQYSRR